MAIQDEMYKSIEKEIELMIETGKEMRSLNISRVKEVAKMLTTLSNEAGDPDTLTNQYIANIKNICNTQPK
jgi:hypothetical protein